MKYVYFLIMLVLSSPSLACSGLGNGSSGCADVILGVQTEAGQVIEITTSGTTWSPNHVCSGSTVVRFAGTDLEKKSALSIAMTAYTSGKGPISFRCHEILNYGVCNCTNIGLGNSWRD